MAQSVRWGLVSTANINRRLIPAIRASERGELVAVASRDRGCGEAYAAQWQIPRVFESYQAMFVSREIDAVYISVPNHLHTRLTIAALESGKAVLCEKPFALTLAEVDQVRDAVARTDGVVAEAFMYRHHPQTKAIGEFVRSGRLGQIRTFRSAFSFQVSDPENVRLKPELGGGCLWDIGVYPLSMAQFVMGGGPEIVWGWHMRGETGVDEIFAGQLHYAGGRVAQFTSSFALPWHTMAEITGSRGRLLANRPFVGLEPPERELIFYPADGDAETVPVEEEYLYQGEVEDLHDVLLEGKSPYLTLAETRLHIQTALALYRSAEEKRPVRLDEITA